MTSTKKRRTPKAEAEANGFNELLVETLDKLTEAECDRDEAMKALGAHKERADRAESEDDGDQDDADDDVPLPEDPYLAD